MFSLYSNITYYDRKKKDVNDEVYFWHADKY